MILIAVTLTPPTTVEADKPAKTPEEMYESVKGPWQPTDEKSPLASMWLNRHEKGPEVGPNESWHVILRFTGAGPEGYRGAPANVEVDGDGLKVTLPPAREGEKRETRALHLK